MADGRFRRKMIGAIPGQKWSSSVIRKLFHFSAGFMTKQCGASDSTVRAALRISAVATMAAGFLFGAPCLAASTESANPRYQVEGATVYDKKTNLTWARCSVGQEWNEGVGCMGIPQRFAFDSAQALGAGGWRVPSQGELSTLIDWGRRANFKRPAIDEIAFPNIEKVYPWYWSSTPESALAGREVGFMTGDPGIAPRQSEFPVRLVRGDFRPFADMPAANSRYEIAGPTVYDKETGLTWARCSFGQEWRDFNGCVGHPFRFTFDAAQDLVRRLKKGPLLGSSIDNNAGWRLPTIDELRSLISKDRGPGERHPTIDDTAFPGLEDQYLHYWSGTEADAKRAWAVNFADGEVSEFLRRSQYPLRMVRTGR